jgi:hypothetical protein
LASKTGKFGVATATGIILKIEFEESFITLMISVLKSKLIKGALDF